MGYLDLIPGVGGAKIVASGATGFAVGSYFTNLFNERKLKKAVIERDNKHAKEIAEEKEKGAKSQKELHAFKKQHAKEENERNAKKQKEENEQQQREITKIAIMKELALSDRDFCDKELIFIYNFIISNPDIRSKIKIQLLTELASTQKTKSFFQFFDKHYSSDAIGTTDGELKQFSSVLIELMEVDGKIDKKEQNYLNNIFKSCGLPKLTH